MEEGEEFKPIRRGWCLGEEKFRGELLTQMIERMGAETTMTAGWIAEGLAMGTRGYCPLYPPLDLGGRVFRTQLRVSARTQCSAQGGQRPVNVGKRWEVNHRCADGAVARRVSEQRMLAMIRGYPRNGILDGKWSNRGTRRRRKLAQCPCSVRTYLPSTRY